MQAACARSGRNAESVSGHANVKVHDRISEYRVTDASLWRMPQFSSDDC